MYATTQNDKYAQAANIECSNSITTVAENLLVAASPILAKIKPSALAVISSEHKSFWIESEKQIFSHTGLKSLILKRTSKSYSILLYNPVLLSQILSSPQSKKILTSFGYPDTDNLSLILSYLRIRHSFIDIEISCRKTFPHEIGLFLGYPIEDVESFIANCGKNYKCCKYWKVYHNEKKAHYTFACIDKAKAYAKHLISNQIPIHLAANLLSEMYIPQ